MYKKVLLVEDNLTNQLIAKAMLSKLGYEVTIASDGYQAIQLVDQQTFCLILMDCYMPLLNGYNTTQKIREKGVKIPIIGFTSGFDQSERKRYSTLGVNEFIIKPYSIDELKKMIHKTGVTSAKVVETQIEQMLTLFGTEAVMQILGVFIQSLDDLEPLIQVSLDQEDLQTLKRLAHRYRSSASAVDANQLAECCSKIETAELWIDAKNRAQTLIQLIPQTRLKMKEVVGRLGGK